MKIQKIIILAALLLTCSFCQKTFAQPVNPLISFAVEACNLDEALEKLFAEYELNVAFSKAELSKIRIESYSCNYKSVEEVLTDLLSGTDYDFKKVGKQYVIRKIQRFVPTPPDNSELATTQPVEEVAVKTDTIVNKTLDTIRIVDTVKLIRTVMRYDTVVEVKHEVVHDTVYAVKYKGLAFAWPPFRNNGWFIAPTLTLSKLGILPNYSVLDYPIELIPLSAYGIGMDAGYQYQRLGVGVSLTYKSMKYSFSFDRCLTEGDYYVNDTLDTYYVVHPSGDTTYQYILDSTYIPLTTTNYAYQDVNRVDYLSLGLFASFDFLRFNYFRMFLKAGASADFALSHGGSYLLPEEPYHAPIAKDEVEAIKFAYFGGLGMGFKVGDHLEIVPEVRYRRMIGSPYVSGFPIEMKLRYWDFRLGLSYCF